MRMSGRVENINGVPVYVPNDTFKLEDQGCYVSYISSIRDYGCETTALVRDNGIEPIKFLILNGDHVDEYLKLRTYDACVEYFKSHSDQKNKLSMNWDEEIVTRPDGSVYVQKIE